MKNTLFKIGPVAAVLIALSLAVKLALMSVTFHSDLIFVQYFPSFFARYNVLDIYGYFGDHFSSHTGGTYYPPVVYFVIGSFQKLWLSWIPGAEAFFDHVHQLSYSFQAQSPADHLTPYPWSRLGPLLVGMKFPYLVFDAVGLVFLCALAGVAGINGNLKKIILRWSWDPVIIFSAYIFGQYRTLSMAIMLGALLLFRMRRMRLFCLVYGTFCLTENIGVFLIPAVVLAAGTGMKERARLLAWILVIPILVMVPLILHSHGHALDVYFSSRLMRAVGARGITNHYLGIVLPVTKTILAGAYLWMIWKLLRTRLPESAQERFAFFVSANISLLLVVYATSITNVQYWLWILPFLYARTAVGIRETPGRSALWVLAVILLFFFNLDSRALNAALFMPLNPAVMAAIPSLHETMAPRLPWGKFVAAARLAFSGVCLLLAWPGFLARSLSPPYPSDKLARTSA